jgi:hypothetical protein
MRFRTKISGMQFDPARVSSIPAGKQIVTDGPFIETKELMGGGLGVAAVRRHISPVVISRVRTLGRGEQKPGAKPRGSGTTWRASGSGGVARKTRGG